MSFIYISIFWRIRKKIDFIIQGWCVRNNKMLKLDDSSSFPSVCIPRTFTNTTRRDVRDVFETIVGRGCVERVDMVPKVNPRGESYQCVFIHLKWPDNDVAKQVRERLIEGEDIKLVYDDPWFWKCNVSRVPKPKR
tara:strand:- start:408 stop:815 length:408 start_codon:yes stop_codon:yes gene_type:complete